MNFAAHFAPLELCSSVEMEKKMEIKHGCTRYVHAHMYNTYVSAGSNFIVVIICVSVYMCVRVRVCMCMYVYI